MFEKESKTLILEGLEEEDELRSFFYELKNLLLYMNLNDPPIILDELSVTGNVPIYAFCQE